MADGSKIEWTDATWNVITGCSVLSPGCIKCYAMRLAGTRLKNHPSRIGITRETKAGPVWTGEVRFNRQWLDQPLRWKRPRTIFPCAHGDLFHENVPDAWIASTFGVMALSPQHIFQPLTKRSKRMRKWFESLPEAAAAHCLAELYVNQPEIARDFPLTVERAIGVAKRGWPLPNVHLGISCEDQPRADERIPDLLATPAAVRWISGEPLLGPLDVRRHLIGHEEAELVGNCIGWTPPLDWVVVGGESGPDARPMHPDWARSLRDQCAAADVPFFFKQVGEWCWSDVRGYSVSNMAWINRAGRFCPWRDDASKRKPGEPDGNPDGWIALGRRGKKLAGRLLDGVEHNGRPEDMR